MGEQRRVELVAVLERGEKFKEVRGVGSFKNREGKIVAPDCGV